MHISLRSWLAAAAMAGSALGSGPGQAQETFPARTVKIVVPAAAGSTTDILGRLIADQLSRKWARAVVIDNIPGAGGNIGATSVARASPDGHTLLVAPPLSLSYGHLLSINPGFDPAKFVPITVLATIPNVLVARNDFPAKTLRELIDHGKRNPNKISYASGGVGTTSHLTAAMLEIQSGIKMVRVSYRSSQPALSDIVASHVDIFFDTLATSVPLYRDNKVKLLAVADLKRAAAAPDVPSFSEAGLPGFKSVTWFGMVAPPATPAALVEKINRDVVEALRSKEVDDILRKLSLEPAVTSPAEAIKFIADESAHWGKVIKDVGIEPQ